MEKRLEYVNCPVCGVDDTKLVYKGTLNDPGHDGENAEFACTNTCYGKFGDIVKCRRCGLVYVNPREKDITEHYKDVVDTLYIEEAIGRRLTFETAIKGIEKYRSKGKVLDVGCYCGFFLAVAKERGWQAYGVEPCVWASRYARENLDLDVVTAVLSETDFTEKSFDLITMWDFLEHVQDPREELLLSRRLLKDDGMLVLTTINIKSIIARIMGRKWPQLMRMHTYYYSPGTITKLLKECGFRVTRIGSHKRIVRWPYFVSKIKSLNPFAYRILEGFSRVFNMHDKTVSIDFGDIMTVYAEKNL